MKDSIESKRLKQIREELNMTQTEFGTRLGIKSSYDLERSKTKISGEVLMRLFKDFGINPLWIYGESEQKHLDPLTKDTSPTVITMDSMGVENILMVSEKAAAGYAGNLDDQSFHEQLPAFSFPIPAYRNATFRCFQVEGYSMSPTILPNEWIITRAVERLDQIKDGQVYVIVDAESIRVKQVFNKAEIQTLVLVSINTEYESQVIRYDQIAEIWAFDSKITKELILDTKQHKLDAIYNNVKWIRNKMTEE